ncbi:hypothetical protein LTR53_018792, partial [Teratosphaeriaceae sp. CCFEE 6253]
RRHVPHDERAQRADAPELAERRQQAQGRALPGRHALRLQRDGPQRRRQLAVHARLHAGDAAHGRAVRGGPSAHGRQPAGHGRLAALLRAVARPAAQRQARAGVPQGLQPRAELGLPVAVEPQWAAGRHARGRPAAGAVRAKRHPGPERAGRESGAGQQPVLSAAAVL